MHVKEAKSNAKCSSHASGRGIADSQKKNLLQSVGWAIRRLPTSGVAFPGQTTGEAVSNQYFLIS